jgi:hypothetical protein
MNNVILSSVTVAFRCTYLFSNLKSKARTERSPATSKGKAWISFVVRASNGLAVLSANVSTRNIHCCCSKTLFVVRKRSTSFFVHFENFRHKNP